MGFYLRAIKDSERAARSLGVAAGRYKLYAYMLSAGLHRAGGLALSPPCLASSIRKSGFGILISVKMLIMAALGGAGHAVRAAGRRPDPGAAGGDHQQPSRRQGAGLTFVVYGAIIVCIARFLPSGLLALFSQPRCAQASRPSARHAA